MEKKCMVLKYDVDESIEVSFYGTIDEKYPSVLENFTEVIGIVTIKF